MYFGVVVCKDIHELEEFKPRVHITTVMIEGKSRDAGLTYVKILKRHSFSLNAGPVDFYITLRGHSTTMWTEFSHFFVFIP